MRLDGQHLAVQHAAPVAAQIEAVAHHGLKSFFISHSSIRCGCVSARQIFSGGCAISRSTTTERVSVAVWSLVHPLQQIFEVVEPALPEPGHLAGPVDQRGKARRAARCNGSGGPRGGRAPARPASEPRDASRRPAARPRPAPSAPRPSARLRGTAARRSPAGSGRRAFGRACPGRLASGSITRWLLI